ncbi:glycosyltransferase family 2 protein [Paracoccus sp. SCSIO 75233]|uniref:glycosyltransferase family 2 protein n=1 Tax=Paracoccus sp. SCSIO 75233 TaxID=3017782 RepID=UPI0022F08D41|nr:glycosyltransferase family 2 protein [Paracoccus sp. SCSIO 75233]WBU55213.1 hypothetical protein PAF12_17965 [Paracoccus sp. SCSIO 75233]
MKVAALTMVYRDHWFLKRWINHYGSAFSRENLYIVSHGDEAPIREMARECNIIGIVRETFGDFDVLRWTLLNDILRILLKQYDCVIIGDVDELVVPDPRYGGNLTEALKTRGHAPASFVTGVEIVQTPEDEVMDDSRPILAQRRTGHWNWRYTKASVVYDPVVVGRGAHFLWHSSYYNAESLLLFHMKFANLDNYDQVLESRKDIRQLGSDGKTRTPRGNGWTRDTVDNLLLKMKKQPIIPFYQGLDTFREQTQVSAEIVSRRLFPKRYFINSWFELPDEFENVV